MSKKKKPSRKAPKKKAARRRPKKAKAKKASRRRRPKAKKAAKKASRRRRPKKAAKAKKASRRRRPKKAAKAAKKAARRRRPKKAAKNKMSRRSSAAARAMGMMKGARKNPAGILDFLKGEARDMMAIAPSVAVQLGTIAAVGFAASKASEQIRKRASAGGALDKYAGVISSGAITLAAFATMKIAVKSEKVKQFTLPVLFGGMAATLVQVLAAVKVEPKKIEGQPAPATPPQKISLGQRLGLPIGDYMALSGFVDVHGRPVAVNGIGDYVPQALGEIELSRGPYGEGTVVTPMGDYVPQALGALTLHEGRFQEGTVLGEIGQMSEGRQGARALNSPGDLTIESFVDSGSLSGSVFD